MAEIADTNLPPIDVRGCSLLQLPVVTDPRGNLTFVESEQHVPFQLRRVYYLYDVPGGEMRAGHAHRALQQLVIAASGALTYCSTTEHPGRP